MGDGQIPFILFRSRGLVAVFFGWGWVESVSGCLGVRFRFVAGWWCVRGASARSGDSFFRDE